MLELVLEERYPMTKTAKDGKVVEIRPVESRDEAALITFFRDFPQDELAYLRDNVQDPAVIRGWLKNLNYERILPLLAFHEGKIVGDATLHQDERGWQTHVGHVRVVTHPKYRGIGIARILVGEIIEIGEHAGLVKLDAEFMGEQGKPMSAFQEMGFIPTATLPGHVQDMQGNFHDLVILVYDLHAEERYAAD
jgi:GNAT superfamily N-acetyltransferase